MQSLHALQKLQNDPMMRDTEAITSSVTSDKPVMTSSDKGGDRPKSKIDQAVALLHEHSEWQRFTMRQLEALPYGIDRNTWSKAKRRL